MTAPAELHEVTASSWAPADLSAVLSGKQPDDRPVILAREDGPCLIYAAKMHAIYGESESLKTWLLLLACKQEIAAGRHVMYLDFEDCAEGVTGRLLALGVPAADIYACFHYIAPREPVGVRAWGAMSEVLDLQPTMAVIDGVTEAMVLHGLDPLSNTDAAVFYGKLPRMLTGLGMAVPMIDHVVKNGETRGRYAIGAVHKMNGLDGAAYLVDCIQPFGRGLHGIAKILIQKDRRGHVREHAAGKKHIADLHLQSASDGTVTAWLAGPEGSGDDGDFRPTALMAKAYKYIEANPGMSKTDIVTAIGGKREFAQLAVSLLVRDRYCSVERDGQRHRHHAARAFTEDGGE